MYYGPYAVLGSFVFGLIHQSWQLLLANSVLQSVSKYNIIAVSSSAKSKDYTIKQTPYAVNWCIMTIYTVVLIL